MSQASQHTLRTFRLKGSFTEIGEEHGKLFGDEIGVSVRKRMKLCQRWPDAQGETKSLELIRELGRLCWLEQEKYSPELLEEVEAIARVAEVDPVELLIMNGYTDFRDLLYSAPADDPGGCTSFMVGPESAVGGRSWIGQTWDMEYSALPHVVFLELEPNDRPRAKVLSLTGCVGMMGINECGVCVTITNLHARYGQVGVAWTLVVRRILECTTAGEAMNELERARLIGGHNYSIMGPGGQGWNIEVLPENRSVTPLRGDYLHSNHCLDESLLPGEYTKNEIGRKSTLNRLDQATRFMEEHRGKVDLDTLIAFTRVEDPELPYSICARTGDGIDTMTCGAVIMSPDTKEIWALQGRPTESEYRRFGF